MQNDQPLTVVDNIHDIMAAAAIKFNDEQLEHLILLIQKVNSVLLILSITPYPDNQAAWSL